MRQTTKGRSRQPDRNPKTGFRWFNEKTSGKREYKKNCKQHTKNSISAGVRRSNTLLDVPRLQLQKHREYTLERDELDMDVAVVSIWYTCTDVPRMEMAADA